MDESQKSKLQAWWWSRQKLGGNGAPTRLDTILEQTGWSRTVGGVNPYLALHARTGASRAAVDDALAEGSLQELPSARGCTYLLPQSHYALGLSVGGNLASKQELSVAERKLGVLVEEVDKLADTVCKLLESGPQDPRQLRAELGGIVRSFGEEGKKVGITTDLPLALGRLQAQGRIRRIPVSGRLDSERYAYALWDPNPLTGNQFSPEDALAKLARLYWSWIGPASLKNFQWFSGAGVRKVEAATQGLKLKPIEAESELLLSEEDLESWHAFQAHDVPETKFVGSLDNMSHLRAGLKDLIDSGLDQALPGEKGQVMNVSGLSELSSHAIYERGRLVGIWEFDPFEQETLALYWGVDRPGFEKARAASQAFVKDELGDARSFSLDGPESRRTKLDWLRARGQG
ncbi:MAG: winged helix DNA-binding domain-containing protein [Chthonomonadaceae bacterium]|nr:winged helix DNA-binding domain-containing protein [Chthonomonadaceae bacterium]